MDELWSVEGEEGVGEGEGVGRGGWGRIGISIGWVGGMGGRGRGV